MIMIEFKKALIIAARLLNTHLSDPNTHYTEEEEKAVRLIMDIAEGNGWKIQIQND